MFGLGAGGVMLWNYELGPAPGCTLALVPGDPALALITDT
jgi:hypothetical protein